MSVREVRGLTQVVVSALALLLCGCPGLFGFDSSITYRDDDGDHHTWPADFDPARSLVSISGDDVARANGVDSIRIRVHVRDAQDNGVAGLRVILESTGSGNVVTQPEPTDEHGAATGTIASTKAEVKTITALVETALGPIRLPTRPRLTFVPGDGAALAFAVEPGSAQAGTVLSPAVEVVVLDGFGNAVFDASHEITLSLANASDATLTGTTTRIAEQGVASFDDLSIDRASDSHRLVATAEGLVSAESREFAITLGPPAHLEFIESPVHGVVGQALGPVQVALQDASGNTLLSGTTPVTLTLKGHPNLLEGTLVAHPHQGVARFDDLRITRPGENYVLIATASGFAGAQSPPLAIAPPPPVALEFEVQPETVGAGRPFENTVRVVLLDDFGDRALGANDEVTLALEGGDPKAILLGTTTVAAANGVAEFPDIAVDAAGSDYVLVATASGVKEARSAPFHVTSNPPPQLAFADFPTGEVIAGESLRTVTVLLLDDLGEVLPDSLTPVTLEATGNATLLGTTTAVATNGIATFTDLHFETAAADVRLVADAPDFVKTTSEAFTIRPAAPEVVVFSKEPRSAAPGESIGPVEIDVLDRFGNRTDATGAVTLSLTGGSSGAVLDAPLLVETVDGRAHFDAPTVDTRGVGYRLIASAAGFGKQGENHRGAPLVQESAPFHIGITHEVLVGEVEKPKEPDDEEPTDGSGAAGATPLGEDDPEDPEPEDDPVDEQSIFSPDDLSILPGEAIRWVFVTGPHTVTSGEDGVPDNLFCSPDDSDCTDAPMSTTGDEYVHRFLEPGIYPYFSRANPDGGTGVIRVADGN